MTAAAAKEGGVRWSLIAAADRRGAIGIDDDRGPRLPWRLPDDLAWFKRTTMGRPVVMGRRTFESIGRALPGRLNVVLTRRGGLALPPGVIAAADVQAAEAAVREADAGEAFVIGGADVFAQFMPLAGRLYLTEIDATFDEADCRVADFAAGAPAAAGWREASREGRRDDVAGLGYAFVVYERA